MQNKQINFLKRQTKEYLRDRADLMGIPDDGTKKELLARIRGKTRKSRKGKSKSKSPKKKSKKNKSKSKSRKGKSKSKSPKKSKRKVHVGKLGGKYVIRKGRKVYL